MSDKGKCPDEEPIRDRADWVPPPGKEYQKKHGWKDGKPPHSQPKGKDPTGTWPAPFFADREGLWCRRPPTRKNPDGSAIWVCAPFTVLAETADAAGSTWGLLLQWLDREGRDHQWSMPRRLLHETGNEIAATLDDAGLTVGTGKITHDLLKQLLGQVTTRYRKRCVPRRGWHLIADHSVYVFADGETFGPGGADVILQGNHAGAADATRCRGTLAEWQENVGRFAVGNHRLGLFLDVSFAAPLLDITGDTSGGVHIHGASQTGKTTLLVTAASVWGPAIQSWRATANGMEGVAVETCDGLLALDEISQVDPREVGEIVYTLANEGGKARAGRDGSARARRTWRVFVVSSGEMTLSTKMGERGATAMAGQEMRLANLPADAGAGMGVFQTLHGKADGTALSVHLLAATKIYCGTAARAFVARLAQDRAADSEGLVRWINETRQVFLKRHLPSGADGQVVSMARRFALIGAAGALAQSYGVLPWPEGEAETAAAAGFNAWLDERGGSGAFEDAQAIRAVRRYIEQHGESRFTELVPRNSTLSDEEIAGGPNTSNRVGFRRVLPDGGTEFLIFPESWKFEVCKGLDPQRAARALFHAGHLELGEGKNLAKRHRVPWIGATRFYTIHSSILLG